MEPCIKCNGVSLGVGLDPPYISCVVEELLVQKFEALVCMMVWGCLIRSLI